MKLSSENSLFSSAFIICKHIRTSIVLSTSACLSQIYFCFFLSFSQFFEMSLEKYEVNPYFSYFMAQITCLAECLPFSTNISSFFIILPYFLSIFGNLTTSFYSLSPSCRSSTIVLLQIDHGVIYCPFMHSLLALPNIFYYEALIQSQFIMGCLFNKDKRAEKQNQDISKAGTKDNKVGGNNRENIPNMEEEYHTEEGMKPSPRPELPSPFKDTEIDPQKVQSSKRLVEKSSEAQYNSLQVNDETNIVNNQRFTSGINLLNIKIGING